VVPRNECRLGLEPGAIDLVLHFGRFQGVFGIVGVLPREPVGGALGVRGTQLPFGKGKRAAGRAIELRERIGEQLAAGLREWIPHEQLPGILLHGGHGRGERGELLLNDRRLPLLLDRLAEAPQSNRRRQYTDRRNEQEDGDH